MGGWLANFFVNMATQIMGVTNMIGAFILAGLAALFGCIHLHRRRIKDGKTGVEPSHLMLFGLIGAVLSSSIALAGFIWQQNRPSSVVPPPSGASGEGPTSQPTH
jgi:hypothetical protein